ncbi:diacylglycerol kinase [Sphingorhabdus lutea]|uniref:Dihydrofolate reductase n=1 Tax=Sphingorhabdus lutea TaxID=1913578 RepID=A0A1L3J9I3_9SPHN|nr:dihydrofolate reductase [Sphingorhabdus lutea]APG61796.1 diacylglycerol kinase [Sphingorhabdus lutea]
MKHPEITLVLARASNNIIGNKDRLPWHIPADMRHFKQITKGRPMIMGRKTFDSLPGLLEGRRHIVMTRDTEWEEDGAETAYNVQQALKIATSPHVYIIGGAEIYAMFLPMADRIELTEIHMDAMGDVSFDADLYDGFEEQKRESFPATDKIPAYDFVTLIRKEKPNNG